MKTLVTNKQTVPNLVRNLCYLKQKVEVISIVDPEEDHPEFDKRVDDILKLKFHDIDDHYPGLPPKIVHFNKQMAEQIYNFIFNYLYEPDWPDYMVIHCHAGISRSPAVAMCIDRFINQPYIHWKCTHIPNKLVERILWETFMEKKNDS